MAQPFGARATVSWFRAADACVMRLVEDGVVSMVAVVHVDDIFSIGRKSRCDQFGRDLNHYVPITNLGELRL